MISGATHCQIRGVIWYQGEHNVKDTHYRELLTAMIQSWRKAWGTGDFPFILVQLANYLPRRDDVADSSWAELRDAQRLTLEVPNTAMAVTLDIGDAKDIHPKNKQEVGRRLALAAEANVYGKAIVSSGPLLDKVTFSEGAAKVFFKQGTAIGLTTKDGSPIRSFALAGEDHKFVWANAKVVEPSPSGQNLAKASEVHGQATQPYLVVTSAAVPKPIAVRYAWADNPEVNLVNKAGLPASSFRSDDWPQVVPQVQQPATTTAPPK
jgi:sialate O-acetylesterase